MADSKPDSRPSRVVRYYRQRPGVAWLIGVVLIPLLLAAIGYGVTDRSLRSEPTEPSGPLPTLSEKPVPQIAPAPPPELALAPLAIIKGENGITLDGQFPTPEAKRVLLDMVIETMGDDVNIFDNIEVTPDTRTLDFSSAQPFFTAVANIPDFSLDVNGNTVTVSGTVASHEDHDAIQVAATKAWSNVNIVDRIEVVR